jgi:L-ascorbate metabolism protein UlaG (beta-lactamase superfamily)
MQVRWYGQSSFALTGGDTRLFIDPFGDMSPLVARGWPWDYPAIDGVEADLLLVTHEHLDHNAVEVIGGDPRVIRSTAGTFDTPAGEVVAVASEHDAAAGTQRGPNTIFVLTLGGVRFAHFGDFGQAELREEQAEAIGFIDLLFVPVGGGPTTDAARARAIVDRLAPRWVVPMHYSTERAPFLEEGAEPFLATFGDAVRRLDTPGFDTGELTEGYGPLAVVPAVP